MLLVAGGARAYKLAHGTRTMSLCSKCVTYRLHLELLAREGPRLLPKALMVPWFGPFGVQSAAV